MFEVVLEWGELRKSVSLSRHLRRVRVSIYSHVTCIATWKASSTCRARSFSSSLDVLQTRPGHRRPRRRPLICRSRQVKYWRQRPRPSRTQPQEGELLDILQWSHGEGIRPHLPRTEGPETDDYRGRCCAVCACYSVCTGYQKYVFTVYSPASIPGRYRTSEESGCFVVKSLLHGLLPKMQTCCSTSP